VKNPTKKTFKPGAAKYPLFLKNSGAKNMAGVVCISVKQKAKDECMSTLPYSFKTFHFFLSGVIISKHFTLNGILIFLVYRIFLKNSRHCFLKRAHKLMDSSTVIYRIRFSPKTR